jgi:glyoxylase-like metal-dependent hydrolase (beta-lactamase superfamily II)
VDAGRGLAVGDLRLELLPGRGHAPGALLGWLPQPGAILASDSAGFLVEGRPHFPLFFVSYAQYQETVARLRGLGAGVLAPGHQEYLEGVRVDRYLGDLAAHLAEFREQIRRRARSRPPEELAGEVFRKYYEKELAIYPPQSIRECCRILVDRSLED